MLFLFGKFLTELAVEMMFITVKTTALATYHVASLAWYGYGDNQKEKETETPLVQRSRRASTNEVTRQLTKNLKETRDLIIEMETLERKKQNQETNKIKRRVSY